MSRSFFRHGLITLVVILSLGIIYGLFFYDPIGEKYKFKPKLEISQRMVDLAQSNGIELKNCRTSPGVAFTPDTTCCCIFSVYSSFSKISRFFVTSGLTLHLTDKS